MGRKRKTLYDIAMNTGMREFIENWLESYNITTVPDKAVLEETVWKKQVFSDNKYFVKECRYIIQVAKNRGLKHDPYYWLGATNELIKGVEV